LIHIQQPSQLTSQNEDGQQAPLTAEIDDENPDNSMNEVMNII
jgi:hypothetical protein